MLLNIFLLIFTFAAMEFVAWASHKYIMHGLLWRIHRDHHTNENEGFFELNDLFVLLFAAPGILLIYLGFQTGVTDPRLWIGIGISVYGLAYMFVHDLFIHQRVRALTRTNNTYFAALRKAHKVHHKHRGKEEGECFGMLWAPRKYFVEAKEAKIKRSASQ